MTRQLGTSDQPARSPKEQEYPNSIPTSVTIDGRRWESVKRGVYCFEVLVNGEPGVLQIEEEIAFDLLGAWTFDSRLCLAILHRHRADLARALARKLETGATFRNQRYSLNRGDVDLTEDNVAPAPFSIL